MARKLIIYRYNFFFNVTILTRDVMVAGHFSIAISQSKLTLFQTNAPLIGGVLRIINALTLLDVHQSPVYLKPNSCHRSHLRIVSRPVNKPFSVKFFSTVLSQPICWHQSILNTTKMEF